MIDGIFIITRLRELKGADTSSAILDGFFIYLKLKIMGTRSTVKIFIEQDEKTPVVCIYQQYDGYISGVGHVLAKFLMRKTVINGFNNHTMKDYANGMGCLAAQYIAEIKTEIGGVYIASLDNTQDYNYEVRLIDGKFQVKVDDIFTGTPEELLNFVE